MGWPKSSFRFFRNIGGKIPNKLFGQPNTLKLGKRWLSTLRHPLPAVHATSQ